MYPWHLLAGEAGRGRAEREAHLAELGRGEPADGVGPERVEGDEAEVEQPGEPDHDVQAQRQQDVDGDDDDGEDRSSSNALSTMGKTNATTMSSAGSPYFLSRATRY